LPELESSMADTKPEFDIAVGVIFDDQGRVLIAQRPEGKHMAGAWEFPGGKVEAGETVEQALARELQEELGIAVLGSAALLQQTHEYPDRVVNLLVWVVMQYSGEPQGLDNQALSWVEPQNLMESGLLPADEPIARKLIELSAG